MNKSLLIILVIILVVIAGAFFIFTTKDSSSSTPSQNEVSQNSQAITPTESATQQTSTQNTYLEYSEAAFNASTDKKRVYFFHASWCPTCKAANLEFTNNMSQIPADVILFKTDYDKQSDLKKKFGITYQHTFVLVDTNGEEVKKWNGGAINELIRNTK